MTDQCCFHIQKYHHHIFSFTQKTLSLSVFILTHSYMMKIRNNYQLKLTTQLSVNQFQKIFASQCDKLFIFLNRNQSSCKCVTTVRKDLTYQFLHRVTTQLKFSKNWQLSCLLTFSDKFFITTLQTVYGFRQKFKNLLKSQNSQKRFSLSVFTWGYTAKTFKKLTT